MLNPSSFRVTGRTSITTQMLWLCAEFFPEGQAWKNISRILLLLAFTSFSDFY